MALLFQLKLQKYEKAISKTYKAINGAYLNIVLCKFSVVHGYMSNHYVR